VERGDQTVDQKSFVKDCVSDVAAGVTLKSTAQTETRNEDHRQEVAKDTTGTGTIIDATTRAADRQEGMTGVVTTSEDVTTQTHRGKKFRDLQQAKRDTSSVKAAARLPAKTEGRMQTRHSEQRRSLP
jgi:hypothetical protein